MLQGVGTDHHIANVDLSLQRTGDTGVHNSIHTKVIHQDLGAHGSIDLTYTTAHYYGRTACQLTLAKFHSRFILYYYILHGFFQTCHFDLHGADNS